MKQVIIYTDGACKRNPGPGGWAAVICKEKGKTIISGHETHTTNNRMELLAVLKGIKKAITLGYDKAIINSDSAYVVNAINKGWINKWHNDNWVTKSKEDVKNKDLWIKMYRLLNSDVIEVTFNKVKGHDGNYFNELADSYATRHAEEVKQRLQEGVPNEDI